MMMSQAPSLQLLQKDKNPFLNDDDSPAPPPLLLPSSPMPFTSSSSLTVKSKPNISGEFQQPVAISKSLAKHASPARPPRPAAPPGRPPPPNAAVSQPAPMFVADFGGMDAVQAPPVPVKGTFDGLEDAMRLALGSPARGGAGSGAVDHAAGGQSMFVSSSTGFGGSLQQQHMSSSSSTTVQQSFVLGLV